MSDAMKPLRGYPPFLDLLASLQRPFFGVLAGALFTAVVQSSAATMGIAIALASEGFLSLGSGITLALGANIGTCATALLAAIGKPTAAVRAAVVHLTFNVLGTAILAAGDLVARWPRCRISPAAPELWGLARASDRGASPARQCQYALQRRQHAAVPPVHTAGSRALPSGWSRTSQCRCEGRIERASSTMPLLAVPSLALQQVRRETARLGELVQQMLEEFSAAVRDRDMEHITQAIARRADGVGALQAAILRYLGLLRQGELSHREPRGAGADGSGDPLRESGPAGGDEPGGHRETGRTPAGSRPRRRRCCTDSTRSARSRRWCRRCGPSARQMWQAARRGLDARAGRRSGAGPAERQATSAASRGARLPRAGPTADVDRGRARRVYDPAARGSAQAVLASGAEVRAAPGRRVVATARQGHMTQLGSRGVGPARLSRRGGPQRPCAQGPGEARQVLWSDSRIRALCARLSMSGDDCERRSHSQGRTSASTHPVLRASVPDQQVETGTAMAARSTLQRSERLVSPSRLSVLCWAFSAPFMPATASASRGVGWALAAGRTWNQSSARNRAAYRGWIVPSWRSSWGFVRGARVARGMLA